MKKRFLSVFLALALCLGLAVPALAFDFPDSFQEAYKNVDLTYTLGNGIDVNSADGPSVKKDLSLVTFEYSDDWSDIEEAPFTLTSYNAVRADSEFTLTFADTGIGDNSYIRIYVTCYANGGDGRYVNDDWPHSLYLTPEGGFIINMLDPEPFGGLVELKAGESVKFKLPSVVEYGDYDPDLGDYQTTEITDVVYGLRLEKWYPDTEHEVTDEDGYTYSKCQYWWTEWYLKVDNDAVDNYAKTVFIDVPGWCEDAVNWAVDENITSGTGGSEFSTYRTCTHVEILTFLWRAAGKKPAKAKAPFTVVSYFQDAVDWAYEEGLIGESFDPMADCTRADAVNYIWQALGKDSAPAGSFTDVPADAGYAPAVNWAVANGVTAGTNDGSTFSPAKTCTRGEIVTFLHRAYVPEVRLV